MVTVSQAETGTQLDAVRGLMRAFVEWHADRHSEYKDLIDRYFDPEKWERELADLPGDFAPPRGRLLLASEDGRAVGCVALRDLGEDICEMKRMFVAPEFQGNGFGRLLAETIIGQAKVIGYRAMRLDTGPKQIEAQDLYWRLGFVRIPPYYEMDTEMKNWLVFMERDLAG